MRTSVLFLQVIIQFVLISHLSDVVQGKRLRRQLPNGNNQNVMMPQVQASYPLNQASYQQNPSMPNMNGPRMPMNSNDQFMQFNQQQPPNKNLPNNQNNQRSLSNEQEINPETMRGIPQQSFGVPPLLPQPQAQMEIAKSQGFYPNQYFQPSPFSGAKPNGWFGTNRDNWLSIHQTELDKNKVATNKNGHLNNFSPNLAPVQRSDGGPIFLAQIAKKYATEGRDAFKIGPQENHQGQGSVCTNFENHGGFVFGKFPCPLPASTGMNQMDVFCCGPMNYQYCCNVQEFRESQRGGFAENHLYNDQRNSKLVPYSNSTKKILAIVLPIVSVIILSGVGVLVFLYYKKFRQAQYRVGKPTGATRFDENYTALAQDQFND